MNRPRQLHENGSSTRHSVLGFRFAFAAVLALGLGLFWGVSSQSVEQARPVAAKASSEASRVRSLATLQATGSDKGVLREYAKGPAEHPYSVLPATPAVSDWRTYNPDALTVELEPGLPVSYQRSKVYEDHGRFIWVGRNPDIPLSIYVSSSSEKEYFATIDLAPGSYGLHIKGNKAVTYFDESPVECGSGLSASTVSAPSVTSATTVATSVSVTATATDSSVSEVDLSFFVDAASVNLEGYDSVVTKVTAEIAVCNEELLNSKITNFRWVIADIVAIPASVYTFSEDMGKDLGLMISSTTTAGSLGKLVKDTQVASGSDEAVLIVTGGGSWGGMAYVGGNYAMVRYDQLFYRSLAHEMGHNFGSSHDRITDAATASNAGKYNYGFMLNAPYTINGTTYNAYVGDIMSYAGNRAPFFANPEVTYKYQDNTSARAWHNDPLGVALTETYPAYAAKSISERAAAMSKNGTRIPHLLYQPQSVVTNAGSSATFSVAASTGSTYQWQKDGGNVSGATTGTLSLTNVSSLQAGSYTCVVTSAGTSLTSKAVTLTVNALTSTNANARLANISTRSKVGTGDAVQILGFVLSGQNSGNVLVRASGPAIAALGVTDALSDPMLSLCDDKGTQLGSNDNWDASVVQPIAQSVGAFAWNSGSKDAAIVLPLKAATHSVIVSGKDKGTGTGLVEVYSAEGTGPRMVNLSTRSVVDADGLVAGFVISGTGMKTLLIRCAGPALASYGLTGAIADPVIDLYSGLTLVASNDNWSDSSGAAISDTATSIGAFGFAAGSRDAALLLTLPAGSYTAMVKPKSGTAAGIGLVEIYEVK